MTNLVLPYGLFVLGLLDLSARATTLADSSSELNLRPSSVDSVVSTTNWTTTTVTDLERQNWWIDQRRRYSKKMKMVWNYSRPVSKYLHALDLQIGRPTPGLGRGKILQKLSHLAHNPQTCTLIFPSFTKNGNSSYVHSWMYPITSHCQLGESM